MPLNTAIRLVLRPIVAIRQAYLGFFIVFSMSTCTKRLQVDVTAPFFNRDITYQTKEQGLIKVSM
jgi:hypothetical protein